VSFVPAKEGSASYIEGEQSHVLVAVVYVVDDGDGCFSRPRSRKPRLRHLRCTVPYAEPFLLLTKSVISRFRARFGSKFCGSHACTVFHLVSPYHCHQYGRSVHIKRCSGEVGASPNAP
jgi:hypothetical protein